MVKAKKITPVKSMLKEESPLRVLVKAGMQAIEAGHRAYFDKAIRESFVDSLELDEAVRNGHEQENRWDYLLGHEPTGDVVAVEPHSAKNDEISTVIRKKSAAKLQLEAHLVNGKKVKKWLWVASGKVHFADTDKARRLLDQAGIKFVGTKVTGKDLS
ncbi:hypothetical protein [Chromobacterium sp. LK11]|uniref:hypothetical protein n=1 Tax=Chromobacterium sp. LK11 TaxID=1628212 RepID=UPI0012E1E615|nr:hypothetical protein [Chromobacterium sp. LK11]